jgi:predicted xylose isomerase-like sugar epimerase
MRETIEQIMETEKNAAEIITAAEKAGSDIISKNDAAISEKLNHFREEEQNRYNKAVEQAELKKSEAIRMIRTEDPGINADLEAISDKVLKRIMKTVFD